MSRTILKIICIVSGVLCVVFGVVTFLSVAAGLERVNTSGGIIGGTSAPTVEFLLQTSPTFYAAIVTLILFAGTGLMLIFCKKSKK